jgi:hypothetical protein
MLLIPAIAYQQVNVDSQTSTTFNLGTADLQSTTIKIVQWVLGFLGLIALIMIIVSIVIAATTSDSDRAVSHGSDNVILEGS